MPLCFFEEGERTLYEGAEGEEYPNDEVALRGAQRLADEFAEDLAEFLGGTLPVFNEGKEVIGRVVIRPPKGLLQ